MQPASSGFTYVGVPLPIERVKGIVADGRLRDRLRSGREGDVKL
jgi:hypothetical protein